MKRDAPPPTTSKPLAAPFQWLPFRELPEVMPSWLIDEILPAGSLICLYGKRGQGKTFLALDWACCIATGTKWQGKAASKGRVAYLLAERPAGLGRRLRGWIEHVGLEETAGTAKLEAEGIDWLVFGQRRFPLDSDGDRAELIQLLKKEFPKPDEGTSSRQTGLSLLVMDPLVFFMDGSENETRDMQKFIDGALDLVNQIGCSILLVHHEGKGNIQNILGARGSSALEAGMDTVVYLSPQGSNDISEMVVTKQREAPAIKPIYLHFKEQSLSGKRRGIFPTVTNEPPIRPEAPSKRDRKAQSEVKKLEKAETGLKTMDVLSMILSMEQAKEAITVRNIMAKIPGATAAIKQQLRKRMTELSETQKLFLVGKGSGRKGDTFSTTPPTPPSQAENDKPAEGDAKTVKAQAEVTSSSPQTVAPPPAPAKDPVATETVLSEDDPSRPADPAAPSRKKGKKTP